MEEDKEKSYDTSNYFRGMIMNEFLIGGKELNERIKNSEEYKQYIAAKNILKQDEELYNRVNEFRRRNYHIQYATGENQYDEAMQLTKEFSDMLHLTPVSSFLVAEAKLFKNIREMFSVITEDIDIDYI